MRLRFLFFALLACFAVLKNARAETASPHLSPLAKAPDWSELEKFQETITRQSFEQTLNNAYAPNEAAKSFITINGKAATILTTGTDFFTLRFAANDQSAKALPRYWQPISTLKPSTSQAPLAGLKIALDPGHLGGRWAKMEERWFRIGKDTKPVTEGDMTLRVANLLAPRLRALGAEVSFVRHETEPVTDLRPRDLRDVANAELQRQKLPLIREKYDGAADPLRMNSIQWESELLFYRTAEIRKRAQIVNRELKPDLVLCLHFNAEDWGDPKMPSLVEHNHLHLLVNGCYSASELAFEDVRFEMLLKLLTRSDAEALPVAEYIANFMARDTGLLPYEYTQGNAQRIGDNPYLWARNLLANRLFQCPVVYIEPYVMNSQPVWERIQMGDYEGERLVGGEMRKSIYREYADSMTEGLVFAVKSRWSATPETKPNAP